MHAALPQYVRILSHGFSPGGHVAPLPGGAALDGLQPSAGKSQGHRQGERVGPLIPGAARAALAPQAVPLEP